MTDDLVLGIDGGGTKTVAMLVDRAGRIRQVAQAGGTNPLDNPGWRRELAAVLSPVAGTKTIAAIAAALPAHGEVEAISAAQRDAIASAFADRPHFLLNDVDAAHIGAFAGAAGILILSGTGSMAWARDGAGNSFRVGGWGETVGDEGSAYWIGRHILSRVSQSIDGRAAPTDLVAAVFADLRLDLAHPSDALEGWVSHLPHPRSAIAALAPLAMRLAEAGDEGSAAIVDAAAEELARHVRAIARHVAGDAPWSYAGGAFASRHFLAAVTARIGSPPVSPQLPPIGGALLAATQRAGWPADPAWIAALKASLRQGAAGG